MTGAGRRRSENRKVATSQRVLGIHPDSSGRGHAEATGKVHHIPARSIERCVGRGIAGAETGRRRPVVRAQW
jgi:hypothetical protein